MICRTLYEVGLFLLYSLSSIFTLIISASDLTKPNAQCYFINSYTTDGSGINHMKYDIAAPTVWAPRPGESAFLYSF